MARAEQAVRDWEKLGLNRDPSDLVLRKPQLVSARARITAAEAAVDKAMRDLERTEIRAPYDCRIERTMNTKTAPTTTSKIKGPTREVTDHRARGSVVTVTPARPRICGRLRSART